MKKSAKIMRMYERIFLIFFELWHEPTEHFTFLHQHYYQILHILCVTAFLYVFIHFSLQNSCDFFKMLLR